VFWTDDALSGSWVNVLRTLAGGHHVDVRMPGGFTAWCRSLSPAFGERRFSFPIRKRLPDTQFIRHFVPRLGQFRDERT
jgi:hypothetical protein